MEQLWGAICAVFDSWMNERAILYRKMEGIPSEWGTAVSVMAMVFGNMGNTSATGVCFSRDAATGENIFNGEWLVNAQGEDVVAGIRTPQQITLQGSRHWAELQGISEKERKEKYPSMEEAMPEIYRQLNTIQHKLEEHYKDMQDMEFTVQEGKLWFLQTRNGKRTGAAMVKIAMDLLRQGLIDEKQHYYAANQTNWMNCFTLYSIKLHYLLQKYSHEVFRLRQVQQPDRSYFCRRCSQMESRRAQSSFSSNRDIT